MGPLRFPLVGEAPTAVRRLAALLVVTAIGTVPLLAHDMWIEPTSFSPAPGDIIGARLRV